MEHNKKMAVKARTQKAHDGRIVPYKTYLYRKSDESPMVDRQLPESRGRTLLGILRDLPVFPSDADLLLAASGILGPNPADGTWGRYLVDCAREKVIPFSSVTLSYDANLRRFVSAAKLDHSERLWVPNSKVLSLQLMGGRVHLYHVLIEGRDGQRGFAKFRDDLLPQLEHYAYSPLNAMLGFEYMDRLDYSNSRSTEARLRVTFSAIPDEEHVEVSALDVRDDPSLRDLIEWIQNRERQFR